MQVLDAALHPGVRFKLKSDSYKWSDEYIDRLIEEYKKFLYLSTVVDFKVTPSFPIDQAWHSHILFTRSYMTFCDTYLGGFFHHGPGDGTKGEDNRFTNQYEMTLAAYKKHFIIDPPKDIWPYNDSTWIAKDFKFVNTRTSIIIPIKFLIRLKNKIKRFLC
jgi:hypothetical protein